MVANEFTQAVIDLVESAQQRADAAEAQTADRQLEIVEGFLEGRETDVLAEEFQRRADEAREAEPANSGDALASLLGELPEESQEIILEPLNPDDVETPEDVRDALQSAEGGAVGQAAAVLAGTIALEASSAGQIESQQFLVSQVLTFLALEDVLGLELETTVAEGVVPLLEQQVNSEYRSKQVSLQDVIEQDLRNKDSDTDYIEDIATYGIKPEEVDTLEEVALNAVEFEELVETPAELGLVIDDETLEAELDRAGYSEATKDFFSRVNDEIRRSARVYQELLVSEDLVSTLDTLVEDGVVAPEEAVDRVPDEVDAEPSAFRQRFQLLADQEAGTPSASDFETSAFNGFSTLGTLEERLDDTDYPTEQFDDVLDATLFSELDGDLQRAVGLGQIEEATYADLAERLGLDDQAIDRLLRGDALDDIAQERLSRSVPPGERSVRTIVGVGEARGTALQAAGVETVAALANASVEDVVVAADVTEQTAEEFIARARQRLQ